jgi:hypothetical protein
MKPSEVMPLEQPGGGGTDFDRLPKQKAHQLDENDAETEGDQELVLVRPAVEVRMMTRSIATPTTMTNSAPAITATMKEPVYDRRRSRRSRRA